MTHRSRGAGFTEPNNDYHLLPVTEKQLRYANAIARESALEIPVEAHKDRHSMSVWISEHRRRDVSPFSAYPTGKQVSFAERISRAKRRPIPHDCFRDKKKMSAWIDQNK